MKRSKALSLAELLKQEADIERVRDDPTEPPAVAALVRKGIWKVRIWRVHIPDISLTNP